MPTLTNLELTSLLPEELPVSVVGIIATVVIGIIYSVLMKERPLAGFPLVVVEGQTPRNSWLYHARRLIIEAQKKHSGAFQVMTGTGPKIILPNRYADELRNNPFVNFNKAFMKDFFIDYPGFEPYKQGLADATLVPETVRVKLTQSLNLITDDLVDETTASVHDIYGEDPEWKAISLRNSVADIVARLSSRVFLGKTLCRDKRWLEITKTYTIESFIGSYLLRLIPVLLRPLVHWFIPQCKACRTAIRDAHKLIDPEVERRKAAVDDALRRGVKPPKTADTIGWMYEVARGRHVDYVAGQLSLTLAAIHTTTEALSTAMLDICEFPETLPELRKEIVEVISEHGWAKTSLYKLKLMDSFLKESQRLSPTDMTSMNRWVEKEITLSDGTALPKNSRISVLTNYDDPSIYPEPEKFDAARFLKMRQQPGNENAWQVVSTSADHMAFGHGQHACPGRFFATNEIKIALCHLLLKYDWQFLPGEGRPEASSMESTTSVSPTGRVQYRRRVAEIDLDNVNLG
ncbi:cytochrome P450 [Pseudomassariella vexata]|uniref:Cytochrome P450 n=1 Tax=Pseudomassariella vexata TaxID=1141098 RepID=A0A1Y2DX67_9PEZI|nr:cytochrome P450 [Pseudomassariella vexata]ORY63215.1 cytochrome P450 [Pseudomassariella vexata]